MENIWKKYDAVEVNKIFEMNEDYKNFLSLSKTERDCNKEIIKRVEASGFRNILDYIENNTMLKPGDKV